MSPYTTVNICGEVSTIVGHKKFIDYIYST